MPQRVRGRLNSERDAHAELDDSFGQPFTAGAVHAGDLGVSTERAHRAVGIQLQVRHVRAGIAEVRCVDEIEAFHADLYFPALLHRNLTEDTKVRIEQTRTTQGVESGRAEANLRDRSECQRIE